MSTIPTSSSSYGIADRPIAILLAMRPKQWTKNLFLYAAVLFTDNIPTNLEQTQKWHNLTLATLGFLLFCVISGSIYMMNDVADREQDRVHPQKCKRPIASGRLPWQTAIAFSVLFGWGGIACGYFINFKFGNICLGYYLLQVAYTFVLKHMVIIDIFAIAAGFCFRAVAGAFVIGVPNSVWLLMCTMQLALFLGFGKRRQELVSLEDTAKDHRKSLSQYSVPFLDQLITIVLAGLIVSYALYTFTSPTAIMHKYLIITTVNVMYGIFRYLYLIHMENKGGSPETVLMEDRPMQINLLLWVIEVILAFKIVKS